MSYKKFEKEYMQKLSSDPLALEKKIKKLSIEIAHHSDEWSDAMGTCFEREDWERKVKEAAYCMRLREDIESRDSVAIA